MTNGTAYTFTVIATTAVGNSVASTASSAVIPVTVPTVTTTAISSITVTGASSGGNISNDGNTSVLLRGVVWGTSIGPTVALSTKTSDGTGVGSFTSTLASLTGSTTYYVRAYATNSAGTAYGNEVSFTTSAPFSCGTSTILDREGNSYNTVSIGDQCWMKENLKVTTYNNGTTIPDDTNNPNAYWGGLLTGARTEAPGTPSYVSTYGYLYNWYAVTDSRKICPTEWHVPSDAEWTVLTTYLGGTSVAGDKMRLTGTTYWTSPNSGATNESGFTALPGGLRYTDGTGGVVNTYAFFWSATVNDINTAWYRDMSYSYSYVYRWYVGKSMGASVRCLKD